MLALVLFLAIPTHLVYASQGRPYELGLFLLLLATISFFALINKPSVVKALSYAILSDGLSIHRNFLLPAGRWLSSELARLRESKNLPPRSLVRVGGDNPPLAFYAPYYAWAGVQRSGDWWLTEQFPAYSVKVPGLEALMSLDAADQSVVRHRFDWLVVVRLNRRGVERYAAWQLPGRSPTARAQKSCSVRASLFCLAGGAMAAFLGETAFSGFYGAVFAPYQILWALPGMIIVFCAALDVLVRLPVMRAVSPAAPSLCVLAILLCLPGDLDVSANPTGGYG